MGPALPGRVLEVWRQRPGLTLGEFRDFNDPRYKSWRKRVYARDKFRCQMPGCSSGRSLNAHHIKRWADYPQLRYFAGNGITLCRACHERIKDREDEFAALFETVVAAKSTGAAALDFLYLKYGPKTEGGPAAEVPGP